MSSQILEITNPGCLLKLKRGFVQVYESNNMLGQIVLDDLLCVLISVPGCLISTNLIDRLAHLNIPVSICGANYLPSSYILPVAGKGRQLSTMRSQITITEPMRKRCWQQIVKSKLTNQAELLDQLGIENINILKLISKTRSGDPDNCEAQGARVYWQKLFGNEFRRDRETGGINSALNYSYAVLRSCMARAIVAAGLHPSFSLHHRNPHNPINLVDDLMEPFRPVCDSLVNMHFNGHNQEEITAEDKQKLSRVAVAPVNAGQENTTVSLACVRFARSFADVLQNKDGKLESPLLATQIQMRAI